MSQGSEKHQREQEVEMTQGFIIMLASSSFPGSSCFVFKFKNRTWGRHTEREMAHVFDSRDEAKNAISEMINKIRYRAPEVNGSLAERLFKAEIVPV